MIDYNSNISDIVKVDYRTADVFKKYNMDFCCGGKLPLAQACALNSIDSNELIKELRTITSNWRLPPALPYHQWDIGFLTDYIVNIHHYYIKNILPLVREYAERFAAGHQKKYPESGKIVDLVNELQQELLPHVIHEEEIIFPYIKKIASSYSNKEICNNPLVRSLSKPIGELMDHAHDVTGRILRQLRQITNQYEIPENACVTHKVTYSKLNEMDNDLVQHLHLENNILFPKVMELEQRLLAS